MALLGGRCHYEILYQPRSSPYAQPQGVIWNLSPLSPPLFIAHFGPFWSGPGAGAGSAWATPLPSSTVAAQAASSISFFVIGQVPFCLGTSILAASPHSRDF